MRCWKKEEFPQKTGDLRERKRSVYRAVPAPTTGQEGGERIGDLGFMIWDVVALSPLAASQPTAQKHARPRSETKAGRWQVSHAGGYDRWAGGSDAAKVMPGQGGIVLPKHHEAYRGRHEYGGQQEFFPGDGRLGVHGVISKRRAGAVGSTTAKTITTPTTGNRPPMARTPEKDVAPLQVANQKESTQPSKFDSG